MDITVCVLMHGDHWDLASRCLGAISRSCPPPALVKELRLGLNACSPHVREKVASWCHTAHQVLKLTMRQYSTDNVLKYPTMRRMFRQPPLTTSHVMWFDDDSYLDKAGPQWWHDVAESIGERPILGQQWSMFMNDKQWAWIQAQPWYNPATGPPAMIRGRRMFQFCQGAWWLARWDVLQQCDWPIPALRHNGGDSLLGERLRHMGLSKDKWARFDCGVRINADHLGRHSESQRRGYREPRLGWHYEGQPLEEKMHHQFDMEIIEYGQNVGSTVCGCSRGGVVGVVASGDLATAAGHKQSSAGG